MAQTVSQKLIARLGADLTEFKKGLRSSVREAESAGRKMKANIGKATSAAKALAKAVTLVSAVLIGIGALAVREFVQWEEAMTGVAKTVDATDEQIRQLGQTFVRMSETIPVAANELARLGEVAGQLGVELPGIAAFVETAAELGVTTNLMAEEAATGLARFSNVMGTATQDVDKLGSVIVDLGNNLATTEREILDMALRMAGAGKEVKLTEAQVLSFAAAMSQVGIRSEKGGTAISRVFIEMQNAVFDSGEMLEKFAKIAGTSADEFAESFRTDAAEAVLEFVAGLNRISEAGGNVFAALESVNFQDIRVRDTLLLLKAAVEKVRFAMDLGNVAWEENTALTEEAARFYDRLGARLTQLRNKISNVAAEIGDALSPIVETATTIISGFLDRVRDSGPALAEFAQKVADAIPGMVETTVRGVGEIGLTLVNVVKFFRDNPLAGELGLVGLVFLGPQGAAALGTIGLVIDTLIAKLGGPQTVAAIFTEQLEDAQRELRLIANQLQNIREGGPLLPELTIDVSELKARAKELNAEVIRITDVIAGFTPQDFTAFGEEGAAAFDVITDGIESTLEAMTRYKFELGKGVEAPVAEDTITTFGQMREQLEFIPSLLQDAQVEAEDLDVRLSSTVDTISRGMGNAISNVLLGVRSVGDAFKQIARTILRDVITAILKAAIAAKVLNESIEGAKGAAGGGGPSTSSPFGAFGSLFGFQKGGIVPGMGNEPMPILAHPGEVVLSKKTVDRLGGVTQANQINKIKPITAPTVDIQTPQVPEITIPEITLPSVKIPDITIPDIEAPDVTIPEIVVPEIRTPTIPEIAVPTIPELAVPEITTPKIEAPEITIPEIVAPEIVIPDVELKAPEVVFPSVEMPQTIMKDFDTGLKAIAGMFTKGIEKVLAQTVLKDRLPSFQEGGVVPGKGSAAIPILAHPGEAVLSREALASLRGAIQANQMRQTQPTEQPVNISLTVDATNIPEATDFGIIATQPQLIRLVSEALRQVEFVRG